MVTRGAAGDGALDGPLRPAGPGTSRSPGEPLTGRQSCEGLALALDSATRSHKMRVRRAAVGTRAIFFVKHCRTTADSEQMKEAISRFSRIGVQNTVPDSRVSHAGLDVAAASAGLGRGEKEQL